jgi:hypothetical protein
MLRKSYSIKQRMSANLLKLIQSILIMSLVKKKMKLLPIRTNLSEE